MIGDSAANYYDQKPIEFIEFGQGDKDGPYLVRERSTFRHTNKGNKVVLWMEDPEREAEDWRVPLFLWDEDLLEDPKQWREMEREYRRHAALKFREDQSQIRASYDSSLGQWIPLREYDSLDNPYMDLTKYEGD